VFKQSRSPWWFVILLAVGLSGGLLSCSDNPADSDGGCDHIDADGVFVRHEAEILALQWEGTVTGEIHVLPATTLTNLSVTWLEEDSSAASPGPDCGFELRWTLADENIVEVTAGTGPWNLNVRALAEGETTIRLKLWHGDHADFTSLEIPVHVGEEEVEIAGFYVERGGTVLASQWEGVVEGGLQVAPGTTGEPIVFHFLGEDSVEVDPEEGAALVWEIADPSRVSVLPVAGEPYQFRLQGLLAGSTTLVARLQHMGHFDFTSEPVPVTVGTTIAPEAFWITEGCNPLATWNYDPVEGPNVATGPLLVAPGETRTLNASFLGGTDEQGIREELSPAAEEGYGLRWTVANPAIADFAAGAGISEVRLSGGGSGTTAVEFRLTLGGTTVYETGPIPILVAAEPPVSPDFLLRKNGVWTLIVREGAPVDTACGRTANPGALAAAVGELTDLYSVRFLEGCETIAPSSTYTFLFDFEDPCIARVINHPVHWGERNIFHIEGMAAGTTHMRIYAVRGGALEFVSPSLPVRIDA
jgi:hypothetical protein